MNNSPDDVFAMEMLNECLQERNDSVGSVGNATKEIFSENTTPTQKTGYRFLSPNPSRLKKELRLMSPTRTTPRNFWDSQKQSTVTLSSQQVQGIQNDGWLPERVMRRVKDRVEKETKTSIDYSMGELNSGAKEERVEHTRLNLLSLLQQQIPGSDEAKQEESGSDMDMD